ncbi:peptidoglycan-binding domain-containing protein [Pseudogemmobacter faecipullorum]|uniref:Peptidoglycan-binding protein n=1 Tax=Pseudogemmobacter faecipullorum TaxID=2755041 RepID=A0ABS8CMY6_9RHOB|nr:peptidoglycan-binding domain-containing protein [Pseudogemmobacter faecipullorum]MCB5410744.1 peptidoglycan-binding protein [Pseudogemmobacter faecipullorum]
MNKTLAATMLAAGLGLSTPVLAQSEFEDIVTGVAKGLLGQESDRQAYAQAQNTGTLAGYQTYLRQFPNGAYRADAERQIARFGDQTRPQLPKSDDRAPTGNRAMAVEAELGLSRTQRATIQSQLIQIGYDAGQADGLWGRKTREAIRGWQKANKAETTGYITAAQLRLIGEQAGTVLPGDNGSGNTASTDDRNEERLLGLSQNERRDLQRGLTALGYNTRGADGVLGTNSRKAIAAWQRDEGQRATGYITADQLREIRVQSGI